MEARLAIAGVLNRSFPALVLVLLWRTAARHGLAAVAVALTVAVVTLLKAFFRRPRPDHSDLWSFPSGHTAVAAGLAQGIGGPAAWGWAVAVGWARVAARRHHLLDVVCGGVLGIALYVLVCRGAQGIWVTGYA